MYALLSARKPNHVAVQRSASVCKNAKAQHTYCYRKPDIAISPVLKKTMLKYEKMRNESIRLMRCRGVNDPLKLTYGSTLKDHYSDPAH